MNRLEDIKKYLCPPGFGVFTVNTAKERKNRLSEKLFGSVVKENIEAQWQLTIDKLKSNELPVILGIPSDCGGGIQRGANWGPLFLRDTLLELFEDTYLNALDIGDVRVIPHLLHDKYLNDATIEKTREALYCGAELPVSPLSITARCLSDIYNINPGARIFSMGGDHSVSFPLVKAWLESRNQQGIKAALIHFDAHTDLLKDRLGIDYCFGSWLYHVLDDLQSPDLCYQYGIRSTGKSRGHWENEFGINQIWAREIKAQGAELFVQQTIKALKEKQVQEIYISFDIDTLDEYYAGATGTPEPEGLTPDVCVKMITMLTDNFQLTGADVVEIAPMVGLSESVSRRTLESGALISSTLLNGLK
ncbi:arginase family protein [Endozoicomonas ascidiicola]|uniref:arginase family protein n=1 Tax=Endozoicomonas ascidiicola TaxID=1698521 RepID=UPI00082B006A|nr:arginase family protein [Endozoicomonas ascidiicola]